MTIRSLFCLVCAVFLTHAVQAETLQPLAQIEQAAYIHAVNDAQASYDNPQIIVEPLDNRLRLQACETPLQAFSSSVSNTLGNRTIGVRCNAPVEWTVYVPVKVKVMRDVVVAARPLAANQRLGATDIKLEPMNIGDLRQGYLQTTEQVLGQQLKYPLAMGMVLPPRSLKSEKIVRRGEQIILVASAGSMEVRMNGTAMEDASMGEKVKVKNSSSQRVVEGIVYARGIVRVTM
ncbi:flagellar basal body P-ring formation chaperone FlgA [Methylophaga sp. OBS4]|uniref:flagellar basal body P-ring formation chaperone FlgA n=1 Tax=Methylophaga sp. OBS4 TaxID=2991935 RepID=UPI00224C9C22|nr:flagellar basal body P-ring formation chaperone FlgA [Methylophaga sp. OBS4]MCX4187475.1 flagellar basal body P-ring formation chaperone FlgA [Methylophaga sp. OBS4]